MANPSRLPVWAPRIAWAVTFAVPLALATLLLSVSSAPATPVPPAASPLAYEEEGEVDEEGEIEVEDACFAAEEEFEIGELDEAAVAAICGELEEEPAPVATAGAAPPECLLRSASARVVAYLDRNRLRVTIGYTTHDPARAKVEIRGGSLQIGSVRRQLGRSGVLRIVKRLGDAQMAKVAAAGRFTVRLDVAGAPGSCTRFETQQLRTAGSSKRQAVWSRRR